MRGILIEDINHTGEGIARIDGKVYFIQSAIPGDVVTIDNIIDYKNYAKASIKKIIKQSPDRIPSPCPYYKECGGCQLMEINYQKQLEYKKAKVKNIFKRYANLEIDAKIVPSQQFKYRNKITLQVKNGILGLFKKNTNDIVPIESCLLISDKMNSIIKIISQNINLSNLTKIILKESQNQLMVIFIGEASELEIIKNLKSKVDSLYLNSKCIFGKAKIQDNLNGYKYNISPDSFYQVNKIQTIKLYNKVKEELLPQKKTLDLYCGTGTIGIYIASKAKSVLGIEINKSAIKDANENKILNNINNINFKCGSVSSLINTNEQYESIIVDPPRSGLDKKTKKDILKINPQQIIYVSCNPITLARDVKELSQKYKIINITLFDLFPNSYHVESCCYLLRKEEKEECN